METRRAWAEAVIILLWCGLVLYAISFYYLFIGAAFGARPAEIILFGVPPTFLIGGLVLAVVSRHRGHAWAFGTVILLLVCAIGTFILMAHDRAARNCYEPDGHYCAQSAQIHGAVP